MKKSLIKKLLEVLPPGLSRSDFNVIYDSYLFQALESGSNPVVSRAGKRSKKGESIEGATRNKYVVPLPFLIDANAGAPPHVRKQARTREREWARKPTHEGAVAAWVADEHSGLPIANRSTLSLLGYFHTAYKAWSNAAYQNESLGEQFQLVATLLDNEGPETTHAAISALFMADGPLDWVQQKTLTFLCSEKQWSRFVAPALVHLKRGKHKAGEQSEWRAPRNEEEGVVVIRRKK